MTTNPGGEFAPPPGEPLGTGTADGFEAGVHLLMATCLREDPALVAKLTERPAGEVSARAWAAARLRGHWRAAAASTRLGESERHLMALAAGFATGDPVNLAEHAAGLAPVDVVVLVRALCIASGLAPRALIEPAAPVRAVPAAPGGASCTR